MKPNAEQNTEELQAWNLSELLERLDHDHTFLCELLTVFRDDAPSGLREAQAALSCQDLPLLSRKAHTLKGMLRSLLMERAGQVASELELAGAQGQFEDCQALFAHLETELHELLPEVQAHLAGVKT